LSRGQHWEKSSKHDKRRRSMKISGHKSSGLRVLGAFCHCAAKPGSTLRASGNQGAADLSFRVGADRRLNCKEIWRQANCLYANVGCSTRGAIRMAVHNGRIKVGRAETNGTQRGFRTPNQARVYKSPEVRKCITGSTAGTGCRLKSRRATANPSAT
jgi:hypothetical protein